LDSNKYEALYVPSYSKYNVLYLPTHEELQATLRISEITYEVESCRLVNNGLGVVSEHVTVEFSNNLWIWRIDGNLFERNLGGGLELDLPRVNLMFTDLYNHSVNVNSSIFQVYYCIFLFIADFRTQYVMPYRGGYWHQMADGRLGNPPPR